jgi:hypothetical protein
LGVLPATGDPSASSLSGSSAVNGASGMPHAGLEGAHLLPPNLGGDPTRNAKIPDMVSCYAMPMPPVYLDHAHIVRDASGELERYNRTVDLVWSEVEKEIFLARTLEYGKCFDKIALHLPMKTTADCVQFYYREKIRLGLKRAIRKSLYGRNGRRRSGQSFMKKQQSAEDLHQENLETAYHLLQKAAEAAYGTAKVSGAGGGSASVGDKEKRRRTRAGPSGKGKESSARAAVEEEWPSDLADLAMSLFQSHGKDWKYIAGELGKSEAQVRRFYADMVKPPRRQERGRGRAAVSGRRSNSMGQEGMEDGQHEDGDPNGMMGDPLSSMSYRGQPGDEGNEGPSAQMLSEDAASGAAVSRKTVSYWSVAEKHEFVRALAQHGPAWEDISRVLGSKSNVQVRNFFHNSRHKMGLD